MNVNPSLAMTLLNKLYSHEPDDNLIFVFFGWIHDKFSNPGKISEKINKLEKPLTPGENKSAALTKPSAKLSELFIKSCFYILTQKYLKIYFENLIHCMIEISIIDIEDILQDINNNNYIEIVYKNKIKEGNFIKEKIEIVIENKEYFFEKCVENYIYLKTNIAKQLVMFNMSADRVDFTAKYSSSSEDIGILSLLTYKFDNRINKYKEYIAQFEKSNENEGKKDENNSGEMQSNAIPKIAKQFIKKFKKSTEIDQNWINNLAQLKKNDYLDVEQNELNYSRTLYRFKKNFMIIPANITKRLNDVFIIDNPNDKDHPIKLIMGTSKKLPVEILDYDSDLSDIEEVAYANFSNLIKSVEKRDYMITRSQKFEKTKKFFNFRDEIKTDCWIIEAKTKLKSGKSFLNLMMIFIRKSFLPPFFDTFKDYYFLIIEKKKLPHIINPIHRNIENVLVGNARLSGIRQLHKVETEKITPGEEMKIFDPNKSDIANFEIIPNPKRSSLKSERKLPNSESMNISKLSNNTSIVVGSKIYKIVDSRIDNEGEKITSQLSKSKINEENLESSKTSKKIVKKKILVKKSELKKILENQKNNQYLKIEKENLNHNENENENETLNEINQSGNQEKIHKEKNLRRSTVTYEKGTMFPEKIDKSINDAERSIEYRMLNNEGEWKNWDSNLSNFSKKIIIEIAESFNSILSFHDDYVKKIIPLCMIRMETFSCFKYYYNNIFSIYKNHEAIKNLYLLGVHLRYKVLLILKEASLDEIIDDLKILETIIKESSKDPEHLVTIQKTLMHKDFFSVLEENDKFLSNLFVGYFMQNFDAKVQQKNKEKKINMNDLNDNNNSKSGTLTNTRRFIMDNRNDFLVFALDGELIENSKIYLSKIIQLSYRNETSKSYIKGIIFPLLNLKSTLDNENKSDKVIINDICDIKDENFRMQISFNEDVMAAMIEEDFFWVNQIIRKKEGMENFYFFVLENNGSNKILRAFYKFLKNQKSLKIDYDMMVQQNFDKKAEDYSHSDENLIEKFNRESMKNSIYPKNKSNNKSFDKSYLINSSISFGNHLILSIHDQSQISNYVTPSKQTKCGKIGSKDKITESTNMKNYAEIVENKFIIENLKSQNHYEENNQIQTNVNYSTEKMINLFFRYFANCSNNLNKTIISCKCLILLCRQNPSVKRFLIEKKNIFVILYQHLSYFNEERLIINTLHLLNIFLDANESAAIETLKNDHNWDEILIGLVNTVYYWSTQGIKCSSKIICSILDVLISIARFTMIDISKFFTEVLKSNVNKQKKIKDIDEDFDNLDKEEILQEKHRIEKREKENKGRKTINDFVLLLLDGAFCKKTIKDQDKLIDIYEKCLLLLIRCYNLDKKIKDEKFMKELLILIENKFIDIFNYFKKYVEEFIYGATTTSGNLISFEESEEARIFTECCKVYFITWNFFQSYYKIQELKEKLKKSDSIMAKLLKLIYSCRLHPDFQYLFEKSIKYLQLVDREERREYDYFEENLEKKFKGEI